MAEHARASGRRVQERGQDAHERRLARAVGTEQSEHGAGLDLEVEAVECDDVAEGVPKLLGEDRWRVVVQLVDGITGHGWASRDSRVQGSGSSPEARSASRRTRHSAARAGVRSARKSAKAASSRRRACRDCGTSPKVSRPRRASAPSETVLGRVVEGLRSERGIHGDAVGTFAGGARALDQGHALQRRHGAAHRGAARAQRLGQLGDGLLRRIADEEPSGHTSGDRRQSVLAGEVPTELVRESELSVVRHTTKITQICDISVVSGMPRRSAKHPPASAGLVVSASSPRSPTAACSPLRASPNAAPVPLGSRRDQRRGRDSNPR